MSTFQIHEIPKEPAELPDPAPLEDPSLPNPSEPRPSNTPEPEPK